MDARVKYGALCVLGTVVPLSAFVPWALHHSMDAKLFGQLLFANPISTFFALDVLMSAVVLFGWAREEGRRGLRWWWLPLVATVLVGGSLGLPLLLLLRQQQQRRQLSSCSLQS